MRHLMSPLDFTVEELDEILDLADDIEANPEKYAHACDGDRNYRRKKPCSRGVPRLHRRN